MSRGKEINLKYLYLQFKDYVLKEWQYSIDYNEFLLILKENNFKNNHLDDNYYWLNVINKTSVSAELICAAMNEYKKGGV